jgi:hypothetical protein
MSQRPHAADEMEADGFSIFDVEHCILSGTILQRQRDARTGEWKYVVAGRSVSDEAIRTVAKLGPTGKLVIITVFRNGPGGGLE